MAERLADAAVRTGGGAAAVFIHAYLLSWLGRGHEAEALLAGQDIRDCTDTQRAALTFIRVTNRLFALADAAGAVRILEAAERTTRPTSRLCVDAARVVYAAATGNPEAALEAWRRIDFDELPAVAARMTSWAVAVACGDVGRTAEAVTAAEAGYPIAIRGYLVIIDAHLGALVLAGRITDSQDTANLLHKRSADYPSPQLSPVSVGVSGRAALAAGRLDDALDKLSPIVELMAASGETIGWIYRYLLPCTIALAMRGNPDDARAALDSLERHRHAGWQYLEYENSMAHAWVAAVQGLVSEAIKLVLSGAETARANGQFAAEVMCLQTATQFGDASHAGRLRELSSLVEGPRARLAARFAQALADGDATELTSVSDDFEHIGDLIAAMDAAAHAAIIHRQADRKGSSLTCSARAGELARRCGGASTPALRKASERLPLSDREREIAMLIRLGLSNGAIAQRLTLSVRTVEGHIYRAMSKTGAADRDELAAMLPRTSR